MGKLLTRKQSDEIFALYREDQSHHRIGKALGIHHSTAKKYIEVGDPAHGIEPLKVRLDRLRMKADDLTAGDMAKDLRDVEGLINSCITKMVGERKKDGSLGELKNTPTLGDLDRLYRLKHFLSGGPDSRVEHQLQGEVARVVAAVTQAVQKVVKDPAMRNDIANELERSLDGGANKRGPTVPGLTH